jgi:hypothetical protein
MTSKKIALYNTTPYKNGLFFSSSLAKNLEGQKDRIKRRLASLMLIDGGVGQGKTTLAVHCVDYINSLYGLPPMDLDLRNHSQLAMGGEDFTRKFRECHEKKLPAIIYDEGGDFSKRGALTKFNAMLNRLFETYRGFKIIVIICLPNFNMLDNNLFDNKIPRMLLNLRNRTKYGNYWGYSLSQMNWIRYWFDKLPKGAKHKCYSKCMANFHGQFKNLSPEREKALDKISTHGKRELLKKQEVQLSGLITYRELAIKIGRSIQWVRKHVYILKIKEARTIASVKYFNKSAVDQLSNVLEKKRKYKN